MTIYREADLFFGSALTDVNVDDESRTPRTGNDEDVAYALSNAENEVNSIELVASLESERYDRFLVEFAQYESEILKGLLR